MNVLSIDPGAVRIGVARGQTELGIAFPYRTLEPEHIADGVSQIADIVHQEDIDHIVLGWPLGLSAHQTEQTQAVQALYERLTSRVSIPVERVDERFSTKRARQNDYGQQASVDMEAARILLEEWMETRRERSG